MELISYAFDFVSFFIQNFKNIESIKSIILFGSVARGEATKKSDVDIFIDVTKDKKKIEKQTKKIVDKFFNSAKIKDYWNLLDINNNINVIVDKLDKWKLKDSMLGSSIILYQKFVPKLENGKNKVILSWGKVEQNSQRVMLNKKLSGYKHNKKHYKGLIEEFGGEKIGANVIIINTEQLDLFLKVFRKFGVAVKIQRVFEYES